MKFRNIAEKIISLKTEDLKLREELIAKGELGNGYNEEMANLHNRHAMMLNKIIDSIGYPTIEKVGEAGNDAAWLVIQHSIGQPNFMRKCLKYLEKAVDTNQASPMHLAYLADRIAVFENRPQQFGTQFDWDDNGKLSPNPFDDLAKVNQRRKSIDLNTLEEQARIIRRQARIEKQIAPKNLKERNREREEWKRSVGWIK